MGVPSIPKSTSGAVASSAFDTFVDLVAGLPQVMAAIKDPDGRYLYVNRGFADRVNRSARDIVDRTVADLFAPELAESYAAQDAEVLRTGRPLSGHLELIVRTDGRLGWYLTSKSRLLGNDGSVVGVAVMSVDLRSHMDGVHSGLADALAEIRRRIDEPWRIVDIAVLAGLSTKQLERLTRKTMGLAPRSMLQRLRIEHAVQLLASTDMTSGEVAAACGFYDQSSFTRQFRAVLGLTPGAYRRDVART